MMRRLAEFAIACALAALVTGCSSPPSRFYTLTAIATPNSAPSTLSIIVGPVSVPALIDRPQIVVTTATNQVALDEFNRWASPVRDNFAGAVAQDLAALLGTNRVTLFSQALSDDAAYRVQIDVRNFESVPGNYAALDAIWWVRRVKDGKLQTGRTTVREATQDGTYDALAAAHSRAVGRLSQDIADAVRMLERTTP
jgi:uncharacterized lipoprotein YmbA